MAFSRIALDTTIEKQIATAVVVSTKFLSKIEASFDPGYIINDYIRTICKWSLNYFREYREAPGQNIQRIYELEKNNIDKATSELISSTLAKLSKEYADTEGINDKYIFDNALKYFTSRDITLRMEKAALLQSIGKIDEAKEALRENLALEKALSNWTDIFSLDFIRTMFSEGSFWLLKLPGQLGNLVGGMKRGWLVGILGKFKGGKSFYMMEFALAALVSKLKVAVFSLEMDVESLGERFHRRISGCGSGEVAFYPMFDCYKNQTGECNDVRRKNTEVIRTSKKDLVIYTPGYKPCSICRGISKEYSPEVYYEKIKTSEFSFSEVKKSSESFRMMFGNKLRLICYPRFSASIDDIERDLLRLETEDDFIPDVVVVDYADILKPSSYASREKRLEVIDDIWKNLARLAGEKHCIVITGSQGNRGSLNKDQMEEGDVAEWIGKLAHVDVFVTLNQNSTEKKMGMVRMSVLEHRHKDFNPDQNVIVLQKLDAGQPLLDSEYEK